MENSKNTEDADRAAAEEMRDAAGRGTCVLVGCAGSERVLRACVAHPPEMCGLVEVRLDLTGNCGGEWLKLCGELEAQGVGVLLTIRRKEEGGAWEGSETERLEVFTRAMGEVSAVDVEVGASMAGEVSRRAAAEGVAVVGSAHDFTGTPSRAALDALLEAGERMQADVVKLAARVETDRQVQRVLDWMAETERALSVQALGSRALELRVAFAGFGSRLVYGALEGEATAPGQPTVETLAAALKGNP